MSILTFRVYGTPAPQGSKAGFVNKATGRVSMVESSKRVAPWRQDVKHAALNAIDECGWQKIDERRPVRLQVTFYLPRPKGHYRTGANAHLLRDAAPPFPSGKPDIDKLQRSTLDALGEAGVWGDDCQVVEVRARKEFASTPGADISVWEQSW